MLILMSHTKPGSRYEITRPIEKQSVNENGAVHEFGINVVDESTGEVREFRAKDSDEVQASLRAVDEMLA
jgi:hypothetical protein